MVDGQRWRSGFIIGGAARTQVSRSTLLKDNYHHNYTMHDKMTKNACKNKLTKPFFHAAEWNFRMVPEWKFRVEVNSRVEYLRGTKWPRATYY